MAACGACGLGWAQGGQDAPPASPPLARTVDKSAEREPLFGKVIGLLCDADKKSESGLASWFRRREVDIMEFAVRVHDHNKAVPANLFLVSSGAWPRDDEPMNTESRKRICKKIRDSLKASDRTWKLFCDTDGDRRPAPFTMLAYGLCEQAIVPLALSKADLDRIETIIFHLNKLRQSGEISTQILFLVWNLVKSQKDEPMEHHGIPLPFSPSKVSLDILDACNQRMLGWARDPELPGVFVRDPSDEKAFLRSSTCVLRYLADNVLKPSEELGMPFVQMMDDLDASGKSKMKFKGSQGIEYAAERDVIGAADKALQTITEKFEAMALG